MAKIIKGGLKHAICFLKGNKTATSLILTLLAFSLCIFSSVAWFSLNRKTDSDSMGMALALDDTSAIYKAYMYDLENQKGTDKDPNGVELNIANLDLNQYDTIFRTQNKYTPAIAKIQIIGNSSMPESGTVQLTIERNLELASNKEALDLFSSSVIRFTALIDSTKQDLEMTTPEALYSHINTAARFSEVEGYTGNARADSKTFVTVSGEGESHTHAKHDTITISVAYTANDWYKSENNKALNVYLYITYDVALIECFMQEQVGDAFSFDDNIYFFENDMKKISVSYIK